MMLFVQCVFFVLCNSVWCDDTTEVHGDFTGTGPAGNMFEEVFKYAYKNYYKNHPNPPKGNSRERPRMGFVKQEQHQYNPPQPQYIYPQNYYMPQPPPPMPPYHAYYPPYYPPHPPPPPYGYPYPPAKEKSAEKSTQNLWELYQQLKLKFETTNPGKNGNEIAFQRYLNDFIVYFWL